MKKTFFNTLLNVINVYCCLWKGGKGSGNSVSFNMEAEPTSLDPQILTDMSGLFVTSMTYESLVRLNEKMKLFLPELKAGLNQTMGKYGHLKLDKG